MVFTKFAITGGIGFIVDASVFLICHELIHLDNVTSRIISFGLAISVTWLINRNWAFRHRRTTNALSEYGRYTASQTLGAAINFGVYIAAISMSLWFKQHPLAALTLGSLATVLFNYISAHRFIFKQQ